MMEVKMTTVGRNGVHAPTPLYKYRDWHNEYHKSIITERVVWMAAPSSFEDEKEFRNFKRYDLLKSEEIYNKYLSMSHERHPNWTRRQHRAHAREMTKHPPFKNQAYLREQQERSYHEYDKRIGVLSLTAIGDSLELWNYYSNNGAGFSVGFDAVRLFDFMGSGGEVIYPPEGLPIIYGTDDFVVERWKQTYNKELKWKWEEEYRVETFNTNGLTDNMRKVLLPSDCYKAITFGWNMPKEEQEDIRLACQVSGIEVQYKQAQMINNVVTIVT